MARTIAKQSNASHLQIVFLVAFLASCGGHQQYLTELERRSHSSFRGAIA
ncbi:hypothetical protein [Nostoc sp.]